jgi:hypothetical protein
MTPTSTAKWTNYFKIVTPKPETTKISDSQSLGDQGSYGNYTWYSRLVQGSASRLTRYREYDLMDNDVEVSRALDTIAEEMTGNNPKTDMPLELDILAEDEEALPSNIVLTLRAAMHHWCKSHDWENRLFKVSRTTAKYGDCYFRKQENFKKWAFVHPKNIIGAIVEEDDVTNVIGWQIKKSIQKAKSSYGAPVTGTQETDTEIVSADEIVRFTLNDDLSDTAPFGESVLRPVFRAHKQKELLEDAILIYRVQRAPERRVFYIDVGKMPPQRVKTYLEQIKNEIKQKKIPTQQGGKSEIDSVYNPQSMSEDFFFAQRADGRGSRVDTLPGGQGLGELADLEYFQDKVWRGLRVPVSYMKKGAEGAVFNDGKVGVAYIEEFKFALYVMRLQGHIENVLDEEFKKYLRKTNIHIDATLYRIRLPEPTNFGTYRQQEVDAALLSAYGSADGIPYLSKRFILERYLQLTDEEIIDNERKLREEKGLDPDGDTKDLVTLYQPEAAAAAAEMGGELGGGEMTAGAGDELGGDLGGEI